MTKYIAIVAALIIVFLVYFSVGGDKEVAGRKVVEKGPDGKPVILVGKYFCPTADVIAQQLNHQGGFKFNRLDWAVDRIPAEYTGGLRFSQAVFFGSRNDFVCNYEWPNHESEGTWIVITGHLIPNAALRVIARGKGWKKSGSSLLCASNNPKGCTFDLLRKKRF